jgi:pimeloyl-ACP methyl ester carboxylesterase
VRATAILGVVALGGCAGAATRADEATEKEASMGGDDRTLALQVDVQGTAGGAPLVLVGGGLTGWRSWVPHQERLRASRRVARVQPLSVQYGLERRALPAGYSIELESAALAAGLTAAGLTGPIDLVAWSYGAVIALDFALDHPGRVRSLTLIEPPAFWVLEATGVADDQARREVEAIRQLHAEMAGDVSEDQLASFVRQAGFCPPGSAPRDLPAWPVWLEHRRSLLSGVAPWGHRDDADRLRGFDRPVLLVKGTGSSHFLHRIVDGLAGALPRARVLELPGGHAPQIAAMDDFLAALASVHAAE